MPRGSNPWGDFTRQNARIGAAAEVNRDPDFGRRQLEAASTGVVSPDEAEDRQTDKLDQTYIRMAERNAGIDAANVRAVAREARQQQVAQQREAKAQTVNQAREFRSQHIATTFDAKTGQAVPIKDNSGSMLRKAPGGRIMFNEKGDALEQDPASGKLTPAKGDVVFHGDRVLKRYSGGYAQDITDTDEGLKHLSSRARFEDRIAKSDAEVEGARANNRELLNKGRILKQTLEGATLDEQIARQKASDAREAALTDPKAKPAFDEAKKAHDDSSKKLADLRWQQLDYAKESLPKTSKNLLTIHQHTNIAKAQKKALSMLGKGRGDQPAEVEGPPDDREQGLAVTEEDKAAHQEITGGAPLPKSKSPLVSFTGEEEWGRKLDAKAKGADPIAQSADELKSHADSLQASKAKADEAAAKVQATIAPVQQKIEATQQANAQEVQTAPPGKIIQLQMPDGSSQPYTEKRAAELQKHIREMRETQAKAAPLQDAAESAAAEHNVSVDAYREKAKAHGKLLADANEKRLKSMEEVPAMKPHADEIRKLSAQREADLSDAEEMYSGPGAKAAVQAIEAHYDEQEKGVEAKIAQVHETAKAAREKLGKIKAGQELQQASTVADAAFEKADTADDMVARNEAQDQGKAAREALLKKHGLTEEEAAKLEKEQAAKHYTVSPDNKIVWEQGHEADALKAAVDDGQVDPAEAEKMRPQLEKLQDTYQKALKEAGSLSTLKAIAAGGGKGLAMLVGGAGGANVGQKLGTPGGVYGKMAGAAVGSVVGAITTGEVYDRVLPILAEYSDLAKSLEASKKLHPDAAGGAELASFLLAPEGLLKPSLFMKASTLGEAVTPAIAKSAANIKETVSLAYQKGGMPLALKTAAKMTGAAAGGGAASGVAMEAMRPHIQDAMNNIQAQFDPLKTLNGSIGADEKAKPATMQSMGQSALEMGLFATILAGHHIQFRDYSTPQVEDIAVQGTLQEQLKGDFKGKNLSGLTESDFRKAIPEQNAADKAWQQYSELPKPMKERLDAPLDAGEQAVYKEISDQAAKLKKADKTGVLKSARQATYGGGAITTLGVEEGQRPAGEPLVAPPSGLPSSGPVAPEPPADGGGTPEVLPPEPSPAAQIGKVAAAQAEIDGTPEAEDVDRIRAEALLAIGQGQAQSLSQDQLHSVGLDVQDGEIVPKKQGKGDLPPMAYVQHGQPIIKDVSRQWLEKNFPLAAQTITRDEAQTREWAKQQAEAKPDGKIRTSESGGQGSAVKDRQGEGGAVGDSDIRPNESTTPKTSDDTPAKVADPAATAAALKLAAEHLQATGKSHNIGHLKAEAEALAAQPAVDEPEASSEAAPEPEEGPGEVAPAPSTETKPIGDQIRGAVEKHVADSDTAGVEPSKFAKHGKMVAKAVEKIAPAFKGVRIVDESVVPNAGLAVTGGVLEINPRRLVQVLSTAKGSNEAKGRLDLALDEELDHRIFLDLYDTAPEFKNYADKTWGEIPQELKDLSADAYFNRPGAKFDQPVLAMAEFYRQYNQNAKFRKITEQALRSKPGLLQKLKDLASRLLKELARIRDGATLPKIRERLDKIIAQIEAARQKLMGIESTGRDVSPADEAPASSRAEVKEDGGGASSTPGNRHKGTKGAIEYREKGGWKLHLHVDPKNYAAVDAWLDANHEGQYKLLAGGDHESGKDFTVYVGGKDEATALATKAKAEIGDLLKSSDVAVKDGDAAFNDKVAARFDVQKIDQDHKYYGTEGIPFDEVGASQFLNKAPKEEIAKTKARIDRVLTQRYGERYSGAKEKSELQKNADAIIAKGEAPTELGRKIRDIYSRGNPTPAEVAFLSDQFGFAKGTDPMQAMSRFIVNSHVDPADVDVPGVQGDKPQAITAGNAETHSTAVATLVQDEVGPVYYINSIQSLVPGKGGGKATLDALKAKAEKQKIPLMLDPQAFGEMTQPQLVAFYRRNGFEPVPGREDRGTMIWRPKAEAEKKSPEKTENTPKSSTQLTFPPSEAKQILDFGKMIPKAELYDSVDPEWSDGALETDIHVTALYGLTNHEADPVQKAIAGHGPVTITLGKVSAFTTNPDYDVLKVDVTGKALHDLNAKIAKLPNANTFPDYKPHVTIAYLKKGEAAKYVGDDRFEGKQLTFNTLTFSPPKELRGATGKPELPLTTGKETGPNGQEETDDQEKAQADDKTSQGRVSLTPKEAAPKGAATYTKPTITAATYTDKQGVIHRAESHRDALKAGGAPDEPDRTAREGMHALGFEVTYPDGRTKIVDRAKAGKIAEKAGQLSGAAPAMLHSEDVFRREEKATEEAKPETPAREIPESLKERKAMLIDDLQQAIDSAPSLMSLIPDEMITAWEKGNKKYRGPRPLAEVYNNPGKYDVEAGDKEAFLAKHIGSALRTKGVDKVTIEVPGKGSMDIWNTKEALTKIQSKFAKAPASTLQAPNPEPRKLSFADKVKDAAALVKGDGRFGQKVFINRLWHAFVDKHPSDLPTFYGFKQALMEANRKGELNLSRADLVEAMNPEDVAASRATTMGEEFHFLNTEAAAPKVANNSRIISLEKLKPIYDAQQKGSSTTMADVQGTFEAWQKDTGDTRQDFAAAMGQFYREGKIIVEPMEYPQNLTPEQRETLIPTRAAPGAFWKPAPETPKVSFKEAGFASEKAARTAFDADEIFKAAGTFEEYLAYRHCLGLTDL